MIRDGRGKAFLVPEVVQTSTMDCGPATLRSLLAGFGIDANYDRLRDLCRTHIDGTSINDLEVAARGLGLPVQQVMIPADHVWLSEANALPCIAVISLPGGVTHFVVLWRRVGEFVQVMDPASGRHWRSLRQVSSDLYEHTLHVRATAWRTWAETQDSLGPLRRRLRAMRFRSTDIERLLHTATLDPTWFAFGSLDAAIRMTASLVHAGGVSPGREAARLCEALVTRARTDPGAISAEYWSVSPVATEISEDAADMLTLRGAVLVRTTGSALQTASEGRAAPASEARKSQFSSLAHGGATAPWRALLQATGVERWALALLVVALIVSTGVTIIEALAFRSIIDLGAFVTNGPSRLIGILALGSLLAAMLCIDFPLALMMTRLGRRVELAFRTRLLARLPQLRDSYFQTRLTSDMAERAHSAHFVRLFPGIAGGVVQGCAEIALTVLAITLLHPKSVLPATLLAIVSLSPAVAGQTVLSESHLRVRTHVGALARFLLDSMLGAIPIRAHGAQSSISRQHQALLAEWGRSMSRHVRAVSFVDLAQGIATVGLGYWLIVSIAGSGSVLLLAYWSMKLPLRAIEVASFLRMYPLARSSAVRLLELLEAPAESQALPTSTRSSGHPRPGVTIRMRDLSVRANGRAILAGINLDVAAGERIAVVGASGAGKTTFVGVLLGWHDALDGDFEIDGKKATEESLSALRSQTVWVDPAVHLWNRSLTENVFYGSDAKADFCRAVDIAGLMGTIERMPDGMATKLGDGGTLVSGGEGQRVRFARGTCRDEPRLVVLDEAFRGLERDERMRLMRSAQARWPEATIFVITHDIALTSEFERVLVFELGRLVEDGSPNELARNLSVYHALASAERRTHSEIWDAPTWRRIRMRGGSIIESNASPSVDGINHG